MRRIWNFPLAVPTLAVVLSLSGCGGGGDGGEPGDGGQPGSGVTGGSGQPGSGVGGVTGDSDRPGGSGVIPPVNTGAVFIMAPVPLHGQDEFTDQQNMARFALSGDTLTGVRANHQSGDVCQSPNLLYSGKIEVTVTGYGLCHLILDYQKAGARPLVINYTGTPTSLVALGRALRKGESHTFNLSDSGQGSFFQQGYGLPADALTAVAGMVPDGISAERIDSDNNGVYESIRVTVAADAELGLHRVTYLLEELEGEPKDIKAGVLDITVTAEANPGPVVVKENYTYDVAVPGQVTIDLVSDGYVRDPNSDPLTLVKLTAPMGGELSPIAPANPDSFTFQAKALGVYPVNYTVTDQKGGYVSGVINFRVGKLTSPDSPLANTPGQTVEWVQLTDKAGETVVVHRPVLYNEFEYACRSSEHCEVPFEPESSTVEGEQWLATNPQTSADFCREYGMEIISPAALKALLSQYTGNGKTLMTELGWPSREPGRPDYHYLVRDMDGPGVPGNQSFDILSGTLSDRNRGISLCVKSPKEMSYTPTMGHVSGGMGTSVADWLQMDPTATTMTIDLTDINGADGAALDCKTLALDGLAATNVISATCTPISDADGIGTATLTLTAGSELGQALVSVSVLGNDEAFNKQPARNIFIDRSEGVTSAAPTLSAYKIEAQVKIAHDDTAPLAWVTVLDHTRVVNNVYQRLIRPGTVLRASWTHSDPDPFQQDATTVNWGANVTVDSGNNSQATVGDQFGTLSITLIPGSKLADGSVVEPGAPVPLTIKVANDAPNITDLSLTQEGPIRDNTAFQKDLAVAANYTYNDPNHDAQDDTGTTYVWENKHPWDRGDNWVKVTKKTTEEVDGEEQVVYVIQTGKSLDNEVTAEFFADHGRYEGNDLRLRMTVTDSQGLKSQEVMQTAYPVADTATTTVTIPARNGDAEVILHRVGDFTDPFSPLDVKRYDDRCRNSNIDVGANRRLAMLRASTVVRLQSRRGHALRYWHPVFASHPKMPFARDVFNVDMWDASTGKNLTQPDDGTEFGDASMVCEVVDNLTFHPAYARVMVGKTLQLDVHLENSSDNTWTKVPGEEVTWRASNPEFLTITPEGLITAVERGDVEVTATYKGADYGLKIVVRSKRENIVQCTSDMDPEYGCLAVASNPDNSDQWFSSPATERLLGELAFSRGNRGIYPWIYASRGIDQGSNLDVGRFADYSLDAGIDQRPQWCAVLNETKFGGRTDWRLPTESELSRLQTVIASDTAWSKDKVYTSSDLTGDQYQGYQMSTGVPTAHARNEEVYVSCISPSAPKTPE